MYMYFLYYILPPSTCLNIGSYETDFSGTKVVRAYCCCFLLSLVLQLFIMRQNYSLKSSFLSSQETNPKKPTHHNCRRRRQFPKKPTYHCRRRRQLQKSLHILNQFRRAEHTASKYLFIQLSFHSYSLNSIQSTLSLQNGFSW